MPSKMTAMKKAISLMIKAVKNPTLPARISNDSTAWIEHIPFAFFIVKLLEPKVVVELGVHSGNSYNAFCQAVKELGLDAQCYGIDTWEGDKHTGTYDETVYDNLRRYQDGEYASFSRLFRMQFSEGVEHFEDGSVDVLHIDGLHTYDAVKNDFETWLPKLSKKGVVLFHDTIVKIMGFGVWKFWEEIKEKYDSLEFKHSFGLGILKVGVEADDSLFSLEQEEIDLTRIIFKHLGKSIHSSVIGKNPDEMVRKGKLQSSGTYNQQQSNLKQHKNFRNFKLGDALTTPARFLYRNIFRKTSKSPHLNSDKPKHSLREYFYQNEKKLVYKWDHYLDIYDLHFSKYRGKEIKLLEIGVFHGGSLQMWKNYFGVKALIVGIDIDSKCKKFEEDQIEIAIGAQEDKSFLREIVLKYGKFDIIIDDGGHTMDQQKTSFEFLFPHVKKDGIYLIEDLHTSYWEKYGGGFGKSETFIEDSKKLIDNMNAWHSRNPDLHKINYYTRNIYGLHFYDSMLIVEKGKISEPFSLVKGKESL